MNIAKKIIFILLYFVALYFTASRAHNFTNDPYLFFSLEPKILLEIFIITLLLLITSVLYVLSAAILNSWRLLFPIIVLSCGVVIATDPGLAAFIEAGFLFFTLSLYSLVIFQRLKTYVSFSVTSMLSPSIKHVAGIFILMFSISTFTQSYLEIEARGFTVPDALLDSALKLAPQVDEIGQVNDTGRSGLPAITPEQIALLKKNPALLKQYGLDPSILDQFLTPTPPLRQGSEGQGSKKISTGENSIIKAAVSSQLNSLLAPYQSFLPYFLAGLFFITLQSIFSILTIFLTPILWLILWILEQCKVIRYEVENRPTKKLVV